MSRRRTRWRFVLVSAKKRDARTAIRRSTSSHKVAGNKPDSNVSQATENKRDWSPDGEPQPPTKAKSKYPVAQPAAVQPAARPEPKGEKLIKQRLHSLDAYRGLIMISLAFAGFGLAQTAENMQKANDGEMPAGWATVFHHFEHVEWTGCGYWDLIQPSFMFMVGMSMAYSYDKRRREGDSYRRMLGHAMWRSLVLIFLGIFLISNWGSSTRWSLMNVLTQMGLGYTFLFLLWGRKRSTQAFWAGTILGVTWLAYVLYPHAGIDLDGGYPEVGVDIRWANEHLAGMDRAWHKNANVGHAIDTWLLNRLPLRPDESFTYNRGGYQTINFLPSLATMLFGLMCGELLRSHRGKWSKLAWMLLFGGAGIGAGMLLHASGLCPLVKRIWTPSWAIYSTGWCLLILSGLYLVIDCFGWQRWSFPLIVVGMNSIAIYAMSMLLKPWMKQTLQIHLGPKVFEGRVQWGETTWSLGDWIAGRFGADYAAVASLWVPTVQAVLVGTCFWLICYWMYRQRIFLRI